MIYLSTFIIQGWSTEGGRELIIGLCGGALLTAVLAILAHVKIVRKLDRHHRENMNAHDEVKEQLETDEK